MSQAWRPDSPDAAGAAPARGASAPGRGRMWVAGLALAALLLAVKLLPVNAWLLGFVAWVRGAGLAGMAVFLLAYVLACVLLLPGVVLTLGAGFAYGVAAGVPLVWVSANLGAALAFVLGRTVFRERIAARVAQNPRFAAIDRAVEREGLKIVLLTRLSPVFPFNLLNYAYGLTRVRFRDYLVGSLVGMLPGTALYVYLGSLITNVSELAAGTPSSGRAGQVLTWLGFVTTAIVVVVATRIARRALDEATAADGHTPDATAQALGQPSLPRGAEPSPRGTAPARIHDEYDRTLLAHVHPPGRTNPRPAGRYNLVVVGGGTAGLVTAAGGAGLGARVALVERALLGGDCLNVGCVPSKSLIAAARSAQTVRNAGAFGVQTSGAAVDFAAVMTRMRRLRAELAPIDGVPRFESLGVDVYLGDGRFVGPTTLEVDGRRLEFWRAVIATGARAAVPPIPGLAECGYLTNETVFDLTELPRHLLVLGGGPIGCELAQTFRSFGAEVTVLHADAHLLPREDADAAAVLERRLARDGVQVASGARIRRVEGRAGAISVHYEVAGQARTVVTNQLLLAAGRTPNLDGLGLEAAGVRHGPDGVTVDDHLRTTNPRIYAAGDVASRFQFTHMADALARIVLANALFLGRRRASALTVPWCTYTSPEIAHVGLYAAEAQARGIETTAFTVPLNEVDRARLEGEDDGFLRILVRKGSDKIVGATLVAARAGDLISEISVAMAAGMGLGSLANVIHPYPTQAEAIRKAGDAYNRTRLTPTVKKLFAWWLGVHR